MAKRKAKLESQAVSKTATPEATPGREPPQPGANAAPPSRDTGATPPATTATALAPDPCPACNSPHAWLDAYGLTHCRSCDPPPGPAFVRRRLTLAVTDDGGYVWDDFDSVLAQRRGVVLANGSTLDGRATQAASQPPIDTFDIDLGNGVETWLMRSVGIPQAGPQAGAMAKAEDEGSGWRAVVRLARADRRELLDEAIW